MKQDLIITNLQDVEVEEVEWLWEPYIPFGKITIVQGDPENGKTTTISAIAAALTTGMALPNGVSHAPADVIFRRQKTGLQIL
jgi:hypothetical protein